MPDIFEAPSRFTIAVRETAQWKPLFGAAVLAAIATAFRLHYGKSNMTWPEVGRDLLIFGEFYAGFFVLLFTWNFIFAPARLQREAKRQAGLTSLNEVLTANAKTAVKGLTKLMDEDEDE
jgi:hypothetical protein